MASQVFTDVHIVDSFLRVRSVQVTEAFNAPFELRIIVSNEADVDIDELRGQRIVVDLGRRRVHVDVTQIEESARDSDGVQQHTILAQPAISRLALDRSSRVFWKVPVVEIVAELLAPLVREGLMEIRVGPLLESSREYRCRYEESSLDFLLRMLSEEGLLMRMSYEDGIEIVEIFQPSNPPEEADLEVRYVDVFGIIPSAEPHAGSLEMTWKRRRNPSLLTVHDWSSSPRKIETYGDDRRARRVDDASEDSAAMDRDERNGFLRDRNDDLSCVASSNIEEIRVGTVLRLLDGDHYGGRFQVISVSHYFNRSDAQAQARYDNDLHLHYLGTRSWKLYPYVPPPKAKPSPRIQSAIVVGQQPGDVNVDEHGRIQVRMLWDAEHDSCWIRVAQPWSGDGHGVLFVPRVGSEVLVDFLRGDIDRPVCVGSLFGGENATPYELPGNRTRSVIRTRSTGSDGYNELSFEDLQGSEEILLRAQRNLNEHVLGTHQTTVSSNRISQVAGWRSQHVEGDDALLVGSRQVTVLKNSTTRISASAQVDVSTDVDGPDAGFKTKVHHGAYRLEAKSAILLVCGDSSIELSPDGIVVDSKTIRLRARETEVVLDPNYGRILGRNLQLTTKGAQLAMDDNHAELIASFGGTMTSVIVASDLTLSSDTMASLIAPAVVVAGKNSVTIEGAVITNEARAIALETESMSVRGGATSMVVTGEVEIKGSIIRLN